MAMKDPSHSEKLEPECSEHLGLFGSPPLLDGEDTKTYQQLLTEISAAVTPTDILEKIWVPLPTLLSRSSGFAGLSRT
jgi:hypothetical protein